MCEDIIILKQGVRRCGDCSLLCTVTDLESRVWFTPEYLSIVLRPQQCFCVLYLSHLCLNNLHVLFASVCVWEVEKAIAALNGRFFGGRVLTAEKIRPRNVPCEWFVRLRGRSQKCLRELVTIRVKPGQLELDGILWCTRAVVVIWTVHHNFFLVFEEYSSENWCSCPGSRKDEAA